MSESAGVLLMLIGIVSLLEFIPVVYIDYWDKSQHKVSPVT